MKSGAVHGKARASFKVSLKLSLLITVYICIQLNYANATTICESYHDCAMCQCSDGLKCCKSGISENTQYCHECCDDGDCPMSGDYKFQCW